MTPPPIPEEAVERAARAIHDDEPWLYGQDDTGNDVYKPWDEAPKSVHDYYRKQAYEALSASGALFLSQEEKRALLLSQPPFDMDPDEAEEDRSARQKLEESLEGDSSNAI